MLPRPVGRVLARRLPWKEGCWHGVPPRGQGAGVVSPQAFYIVRFHSFYPWHTGGDYRQLCSEQDLAMLPWVQEFKCVPAGVGAEEGLGSPLVAHGPLPARQQV